MNFTANLKAKDDPWVWDRCEAFEKWHQLISQEEERDLHAFIKHHDDAHATAAAAAAGGTH